MTYEIVRLMKFFQRVLETLGYHISKHNFGALSIQGTFLENFQKKKCPNMDPGRQKRSSKFVRIRFI